MCSGLYTLTKIAYYTVYPRNSRNMTRGVYKAYTFSFLHKIGVKIYEKDDIFPPELWLTVRAQSDEYRFKLSVSIRVYIFTWASSAWLPCKDRIKTNG